MPTKQLAILDWPVKISPCRPQLIRYLYHSKSYTPILCCFCAYTHTIHDLKNSTILVYMIINGKGLSMSVVYMSSVVSIIFNRSTWYSWLLGNKIFLLLFKCFLFVCIVVSVYHSWAKRTTWIVSLLVQGFLDTNTFSTLAVHYTCTNRCYALLLLLTVHIKGQLQLPSKTL